LRILLVTDHFGSGGAQRQLVTLACALEQRGHSVEIFIYFPEYDFFRARIEDRWIPVHEYNKGKGFSFGVLCKLSSLMRYGGFDVVLSYLNSANIYAELARLISRVPKLVVSERTSHANDKSLVGAYVRRFMHVFSDHLIANSQAHTEWLNSKWWLNGRVSCIYNGIDIDLFNVIHHIPESHLDIRLLAVGRIGPEKNIIKLIDALNVLYRESGYVPEVGWAGKRDISSAGQRYCRQVDELLERSPQIRNRWHWLGEQANIPQLLQQYHALIHPSLYEGLPNAVCEALAAGMPVLISNVCDHPLLVADNERGFIFDPKESHSKIGRAHV
jgi:glycosyltransferase involved in cell wall biosynthesis